VNFQHGNASHTADGLRSDGAVSAELARTAVTAWQPCARTRTECGSRTAKRRPRLDIVPRYALAVSVHEASAWASRHGGNEQMFGENQQDPYGARHRESLVENVSCRTSWVPRECGRRRTRHPIERDSKPS
jgi:hypothetical protein